MSNLKIYMIGVLILGNISLSFGVVYLEHLTRTKYRELQSLSNEKYNLNIEWKKSTLEKGKHDSLSKIEKIAQSRLKMIAPKKREFININE